MRKLGNSKFSLDEGSMLLKAGHGHIHVHFDFSGYVVLKTSSTLHPDTLYSLHIFVRTINISLN